MNDVEGPVMSAARNDLRTDPVAGVSFDDSVNAKLMARLHDIRDAGSHPCPACRRQQPADRCSYPAQILGSCIALDSRFIAVPAGRHSSKTGGRLCCRQLLSVHVKIRMSDLQRAHMREEWCSGDGLTPSWVSRRDSVQQD